MFQINKTSKVNSVKDCAAFAAAMQVRQKNHVITEVKVFREGKISTVHGGKQWHCYCSHIVSQTILLGMRPSQIATN